MSFQSGPLGRSILICVALAAAGLALSGCGRRGPLEAPNASTTPTGAKVAAASPGPGRAAPPAPTTLATQQAGVVQDTVDDEDTEDTLLESVNPSPTPKGRRSRAYGVPKEPFVLDPLL